MPVSHISYWKKTALAEDTGRPAYVQPPFRMIKGADGSPVNWKNGGWVTSTSYALNDALSYNGSSYRAKSAHTSGSTTEPGIGASWATVWEVFAAKGAPGTNGPIPIMGNTHATIAAGETKFTTPGLMDDHWVYVYVPVPMAGTFSDLTCVTGGAPGAGETWTFTLQELFSDTALTCTIPNGTNQASDNTHSVHVTAGARWCIKIVASAGAGYSGFVLFSLVFTPD